MNRRKPQMPPRRPQGRPEHYWRRWRRWPHYWDHDWYDYDWYDYDYDYDYDWYDYDWYHSDKRNASKQKAVKKYLKVDPLLIGNLLEYASTEQPTPEAIQGMLDRMISLSGMYWEEVLIIDDYDSIVTPTPPQQPLGE